MDEREMTGANFKAARELCGYTQQQVADAMEVGVKTVKRWERGDMEPTLEVRMRMVSYLEAHLREARDFARAVLDGIGDGTEADLEYFRTQEQYEAAHDPVMHYQMVNAITRAAAERLMDEGVSVTFHYPEGGRDTA